MNKNSPQVSVIIASYNHEKYVAQAIESVLQQTFQDFEIIITDDGSSDATVAEIKKIQDPRIRLLCFEENHGACAAMNNCIVHALGAYIAVLNSDDFWMPQKLELQVAFLQKNTDIAAVFSNALFVDEYGQDFPEGKRPYFFHVFEQENRSQGGWLKRFFLEGNCLCHPSLLIKKECYDVLGLYDNRYRQLPDFDMWIRLCKKYKLHVMPDTLVKFRLLPAEQNASNQTSYANRIRNINDFYFIINNLFEDLPVDLFRDGFSEFIKRPFGESAAEYECEKVFVFLECNIPWALKCYQMIAFQRLYHLLADDTYREILKEKYSFDVKSFMALSATIDYFDPQTQGSLEKQRSATAAESATKTRDSVSSAIAFQQSTEIRLIKKILKKSLKSLTSLRDILGNLALKHEADRKQSITKYPAFRRFMNSIRSSKKQCPVCEMTVQSYLPIYEEYLQLVTNNKFIYPLSDFETLSLEQYSCPHCLSFDRDRLCALYMDLKFKELDVNKKYRFIEFAPSKSLSRYIKKHKNVDYKSADLFMDEADDKVDLMDMHQYADDSVDMFCCSHVLEHVTDDLMAMRELHRILKKGGWGIVLVPILLTIQDVLQDPSIATDADRWKHYGQNDHVRLYSRQGLVNRLEDCGFNVSQYDINYFGITLFESSGLDSRSVLYVVEK